MPREAVRQLTLDLPHAARLGVEDFWIAPSNQEAHDLVTSWPRWPDRSLLLAGPEGAGKSHLAAIWRAQTGGVQAADMDSAIRSMREDAATPMLVEDVDGASETALFHLLNVAREGGGCLLLTARSGPTSDWPRLPDLASRLRALPTARLGQPDDATVEAVLVKLLDDRQLRVDADVVSFLAQRCDRSLGAVRRLAAAIDRESLARGRAVGRKLAGDVLARLQEEEGE
jgi:chromosomal replication initiation ATPase DnaA